MEARKHITWEDLGGGSGVGCVGGWVEGGGGTHSKHEHTCVPTRRKGAPRGIW